MIKKLESLRDKLSDLSKRNRSLRLLKIYDKWNFDLSSLDNLESKHVSTSKIINSLFDNNDSITLLNSMTSEELALKLNAKINTLYRNLSMLEEQTGIYDLYIGYPFISGKMMDGTFIQAPVFLFPVRLEKNVNGQSGWVLRLQPKEEAFLNRTLLLAFQKYNNQKIDEQIMEDAKELPQNGFQEWVSILFQKYGINCYWAKRKVVPLHEYKSTELPKSPNNFVAIAPYLILGYFSQGSTTILKDYEELLDKTQENKDLGFVNDLLLKEDETDDNQSQNEIVEEISNLDDINENKQFFITEMDASQEKVIVSAENEKGLVVHGPPGTGKSQVIVNLISQALANKKKILVVCQKRAALDVVNQRLELQGLKDHVALVHNANSDRKHLYTKIFKLLSNANDEKSEDNEIQFNKLCSKIEIEKNYFKTFESQSVKKRPCGLTIYELYNMSKKINRDEKFVDLGDLPIKVDYEKLQSIKDEIIKLGNFYGKYGNKDYPWVNRKSFYQIDYSSLMQVDKDFDAVIDLGKKIIADKSKIGDMLKPYECWETEDIINSSIEKINDFKDNKIFSDIKLFIFIKTKGKAFFTKLGIEKATLKQIKSDSFESVINRVFDIDKYSKDVKNYIRQLSFLKEYLLDEEFIKNINNIKDGQINTDILTNMKKTMQSDVESLSDMDYMIHELDEETSIIVKILTSQISINYDEKLGEKWYKVLWQSFFMRWIEQAEKSYPNFKNVSTGTFNEHINKFTKLLNEKTQSASQYIIQILEEQIQLTKKEHSRSIKDINYQVSKVRKIWPIRKLMYSFWDKGLLDIMPVWLVSPETVSAIFPLIKGMFDVVIFDEASQCFVENGLPSFYRAKKVIVAGDEKQLSPFDLFKVGLDESDLVTMDEEEYTQSLLTLSKRCYSTKLLAWHYRSKYEELINFSNYAFYNGLIKIAPNVMLNDYTRSLEWIKVDGKWENQCNEIEATKICAVLKQIFNEHVESSVGIITFNKKQQELIMDKIDEQCANDDEFNNQLIKNNTKKLDEKLFIKNIENVQGDERDIIIFSIGYAKNDKGKVSVNFGSLNKMGGENRLNVAITRAKQKVIIVSSVLGEDLEVEHSKNPGPKLFKSYLKYAYAVSNNNKEQIKAILYEMNENTSNMNIKDMFKCKIQKEIYDKLIERGYKVDTNVGSSGYKIDLAIINPEEENKYILGIELDDKMYHNARSIKEREIYRKQFLINKGWNIIRVWSRNWWKDQTKELKRIEESIKLYSE